MPRQLEATTVMQVDGGDTTAWLLVRMGDALVGAFPFPEPADALLALRHGNLGRITAATVTFLRVLDDDPLMFPAIPRTPVPDDSTLRGYMAGLPWVPLHLLVPTQNGQTT